MENSLDCINQDPNPALSSDINLLIDLIRTLHSPYAMRSDLQKRSQVLQ